MKSTQNLILVFGFTFALFACEQNNPLGELGDLNGVNVANVYMEPLAPQIQAGLSRELEVQYWSLDDDFSYTGLWDSVAVSAIYKVTIDAVEFSASSSETEKDWTEFRAYPFNFSNWNPNNKAYTQMISYTIDLAYDKLTRDKSDISIDQFLANTPENFSEEMYAAFAGDLSKSTLNSLLVNNGAMSQVEFDSQYGANGNLTATGTSAVIAGMKQLGDEIVIGDGYQLESEYRVFLGFRAINGSGVYNDFRRSFLVF